MLKTGVYTAECPQCKVSTLIHLASDGSINPHKCSKCELDFKCVEYGERRNTFVIVPKAEESKIAVTEEAEEPSKNDESSFENFQLKKKASEESFKAFQPKKKSKKNSFEW